MLVMDENRVIGSSPEMIGQFEKPIRAIGTILP